MFLSGSGSPQAMTPSASSRVQRFIAPDRSTRDRRAEQISYERQRTPAQVASFVPLHAGTIVVVDVLVSVYELPTGAAPMK